MKILSNAFSINMINVEDFTFIRIKPIKSWDIPADIISAIGHEDTAKVVSNILDRKISSSRLNIKMKHDDILYVAQYDGPRLPEGSTRLPAGATIRFFEITIKPPSNCGGGCSDGNWCGNTKWMMGF